jgi:uncharacterized membrane protein
VVPAIVTFYSLVVFVHVAAVAAGLGITFSYPLLWATGRTHYRRAMPYLLHTQDRIGKAIIGPSVALILASGLYMAITEDGGYDFSPPFVQVGLVVAIALLLAGPLVFGRSEVRLAELAERDISASGDGEVGWSEEFDLLYRRLTSVGLLANAAVLVAIFFMVVKP